MGGGFLNRAQLLRTVSDRTGMAKKEVEQVWEHALRTIQDAVRKGEKVGVTGFGNFTQRVRKARKAGMGKNPFTGETVKVAARPAQKLPKFVPAKQFKEYVSGSIKALPPVGGTAKKAASKGKAKTGPKKSTAKKAPAKRKR
jgi:DNA-binding protein HU-beta